MLPVPFELETVETQCPSESFGLEISCIPPEIETRLFYLPACSTVIIGTDTHGKKNSYENKLMKNALQKSGRLWGFRLLLYFTVNNRQRIHTGPGAHPASCKMGTGSLPGVKCGRGVLLTTHPLLVPRSWKSTAIYISTHPLDHTGPVTGSLYILPFNRQRMLEYWHILISEGLS